GLRQPEVMVEGIVVDREPFVHEEGHLLLPEAIGVASEWELLDRDVDVERPECGLHPDRDLLVGAEAGTDGHRRLEPSAEAGLREKLLRLADIRGVAPER